MIQYLKIVGALSVIGLIGYGSFAIKNKSIAPQTASIIQAMATVQPTPSIHPTITPEIAPTPSPSPDQSKEIANLKKEVETLKNSKPKIVYNTLPKPTPQISCDDISLDKSAPGYTLENLQNFLNNIKDTIKNVSATDAKYTVDVFIASEWKAVKPECKSYIDNLVESRRTANKQEEEIKKISDQQEKLIKYNQCLTTASQLCYLLLY